MVASVLERTGATLVHNRAGANMAGGVASALAAASRRGGRALAGDFGLFEVDEFWLGPVVERARAARAAARQPLPRPARPLRRARDDRRPLGGRRGRRRRGRAALVLNADDPLVADLGRANGARAAGRHPLFFGVDDDRLAHAELQHAADSKHCRRCGHPYVYDAAYLAHLGHYHCPNCGARRPEPAVVARDVELRGIRSAAFTLHAPAGTARIELPLPGLYNVYNARRRRRRSAWRSASPLDAVAAGLEAVAPAFGRAETVELGGRADLDPARQEPRRRQRGPAHARAGGRASSTSSACSTTAPPTGATSRGSGTPTGSSSRPPCGA